MSISVRNLVKNYGASTVVHGISFDVAKGEFLSLLGPSGCGKTTTLRCLAGLEHADGGEIVIGSETVSAPARNIMAPPHARDIGMVFQSYAIWPHMTVAENVGFPLTIKKVKGAELDRKVDDALEIVGLRALRDRAPSQLSGGQQQRVALARAIVGNPAVLLFDEPLSNLDAKLRESTRSEIRRLQRDLNVAAVYVTHDQEEALSMSDRVIVMSGGHIMQEGPPKELYRRPLNHFVADFVGRASFIDVRPDGRGAWSLPDGTPIRVEGPADASSVACKAMVRPEAIQLLDASRAPQDSDADVNVLPGVVRQIQYLGPHNEYAIATSGAVIKVYAPVDLAEGSNVVLRFRQDDCRLVRADV